MNPRSDQTPRERSLPEGSSDLPWNARIATPAVSNRELAAGVSCDWRSHLFGWSSWYRIRRRFPCRQVGRTPAVARHARAWFGHRRLRRQRLQFDFRALRVVGRYPFRTRRAEFRVARDLRAERARQRFAAIRDPAFAVRRALDELRFARHRAGRVDVAVPAVAGVVEVRQLGEVDV